MSRSFLSNCLIGLESFFLGMISPLAICCASCARRIFFISAQYFGDLYIWTYLSLSYIWWPSKALYRFVKGLSRPFLAKEIRASDAGGTNRCIYEAAWYTWLDTSGGLSDNYYTCTQKNCRVAAIFKGNNPLVLHGLSVYIRYYSCSASEHSHLSQVHRPPVSNGSDGVCSSSLQWQSQEQLAHVVICYSPVCMPFEAGAFFISLL